MSEPFAEIENTVLEYLLSLPEINTLVDSYKVGGDHENKFNPKKLASIVGRIIKSHYSNNK